MSEGRKVILNGYLRRQKYLKIPRLDNWIFRWPQHAQHLSFLVRRLRSTRNWKQIKLTLL